MMIQKHFVRMILCFIFSVSLNVHAWANTSIGTWNIAVLMVDFSDNPGQMTQSYFNTLLFGNHPSNAPYGSLKDYYNEVSYGQLNLTGQVNNGSINWYRMPHPYSYYLNSPLLLLPDAVQAARNAGFNFGPFDQDNDGYVDAIILVHSGTGGELSGRGVDIWSFASNDTSINTGAINSLGNPVYTSRYTEVPEWYGSPGFMTIGVFAHEFGHDLGVPDLYDPDYSSNGLGNWSLMAGGSWNGYLGNRPAHMDAWSKMALGWVSPVVPSTAVSLNLPPVETNPTIYKLRTATQEYFLLENRQNTGFDTSLPGKGLLIYHIDDLISTYNSQEWYPGCICTSHYQVSLIQADDNWDLEHYGFNRGDGGDPYPGNSNNLRFYDSSSPNSKTYLNINSGVSLTNISLSGANILASLSDLSSNFTTDFPITQAPHRQTNPHVAFDGTNFMAIWDDFRSGSNQVYATRVASSGTVMDATGILVADGTLMDISFDGTNYLALWGTLKQGGWWNLFVSRISTAGIVLDPTGISIGVGGSAHLAFDGTNYMAVWTGGYFQIYAARITPSGNILDPGGFLLVSGPEYEDTRSIAYGGGNYFLVWADSQPTTGINSTYGSRMTSSGILLDNPPILFTHGCCYNTTVVYQGSSFLILWPGNGVRVDSLGNRLDTTPLVIPNNGSPTSAVFDGLNTLVTWNDPNGGILGNYVSPAGTIINASPLVISSPYFRVDSPAIGVGNNGFLAVWPDWRNEPSVTLNLHWSTCDPASDIYLPNLCNVDIYSNFTPTVYRALSITKSGTGTGTVTSNPAGINCGAICSTSFLNGTMATITAGSATGSFFVGWSGGCSGTASTCTMTMTGNVSVTANFATGTAVPDLISTYLTASASGTNLILNDRVRNQGNGAAGPFTVSFHLSADTVFQAGTDILICSRSVVSLGAGLYDPASANSTTTCAIPAGTAAGSYYVLAVVDSGNTVPESLETNNTRATTTKLAIGPDLIPVTLTALASGTTVTVSDQVKNQGNQSAGAFTINYYLSSDNVYQAGTDLLLCSRSMAGLAVGISDPATGTTATPCTAGVIGKYYVLAVVDEAGAVTETLETNNTKATAVAITIGPDLISNSLTAALSGTTINVSDAVKNQGTASAGAFAINYYLSLDNLYQAGTDLLLCNRSVASLAAGTLNPATGSAITPCAIPAGTAAGSYYVLAVVDEAGAVLETVETNNTKATTTKLAIGPDLIPVTLTALASGTTVTVSDQVKNQGNQSAGAFTINYYLSSDNLYQAGTDTLLCNRSVASLAAGTLNPATGSAITPCAIPAGTAAGSYYVLAVVDEAGAVLETVETNNTKATAVAITIGPDLISNSLTAALSGTTINVSDAVKNQGTASAGAFAINYYLSLDNLYQAGTDLLLCNRSVASLAAGILNPAMGSTITPCAIPAGTAAGSYYVLAVVDSGNTVPESLETNNTRATTTKVAIGPDLIPVTLTALASGTTVTVSDQVKNQGNQSAGAFTINYYLSSDTLYQAGTDTLLCSRSVASLAAGVLDPATGTTATPCTTGVIGSYYVLAVVDEAGAVTETLETNNTKATTTKVVVGPDLISNSFTAALSGTTINVSDAVKNQGTASAGAFAINYYLSLDNLYQAGTDLLLCNRSVASLAAGTLNPATGSTITPCAIPAGTAAGSYYVLAVVDEAGAVLETVETNNTRATTTKLAIGPDLIPVTLTALASGTTVTVSDQVKNQGNQSAGAFTINYYLSSDTLYQAGTDLLLCSRSVAGLAVGISDPSTGTTATPCTAGVIGSYYVLAVVDEASAVTETLETNNTKATATKLTIP